MMDVRDYIYNQIDDERHRQNRLKAQGKFKYTNADPEMRPFEKLAVVAEEFGEVARGVLNCEGHSTDYTDPDRAKLRKELIELCAVSVAWIEDIDRGQ